MWAVKCSELVEVWGTSRDAQFKFVWGALPPDFPIIGGRGKIAPQISHIGGQDFENPNISSA